MGEDNLVETLSFNIVKVVAAGATGDWSEGILVLIFESQIIMSLAQKVFRICSIVIPGHEWQYMMEDFFLLEINLLYSVLKPKHLPYSNREKARIHRVPYVS